MRFKCVHNQTESGVFSKSTQVRESVTIGKEYDGQLLYAPPQIVTGMEVGSGPVLIAVYDDDRKWASFPAHFFAPA
jgi:hypothetical protein